MKAGAKALFGALVAVCCLVMAPGAVAAPPANDNFAAAEDLGVGLPVQVERSNYGATKEIGEPPSEALPISSGHSVWFRWEAADTGFVTLSTCGDSFFGAVLGVYTGPLLDELTEVAGNSASEGPECVEPQRGSAVSFKALAGVEYKIFVDGYQRFPEEPEDERGQGAFRLGLRALPLPANDAFANAAVLEGQARPDGGYSAQARGFTWGATKEPGEPAHAGDQGGASVWYAWTAPATASYGVSVCGPYRGVLGLYAGDALSTLVPVGANDCSGGGGLVIFRAEEGSAYRIAIDGKYVAGSGTATMGSFLLGLFRMPPGMGAPTPPVAFPEPPPIERKAIDTVLRKRVVSSERRRATFRFGATSGEARFRCQLDKRAPTWCRSPKTYEHLSIGPHSFKVTAIDATSSGDGTPPVANFRISRVGR